MTHFIPNQNMMDASHIASLYFKGGSFSRTTNKHHLRLGGEVSNSFLEDTLG